MLKRLNLVPFGFDPFSYPFSSVDYTLFFRELSNLPKSMDSLEKSFYESDNTAQNAEQNTEQKTAQNTELNTRWATWLKQWNALINKANTDLYRSNEECIQQMKQVNPKYSLQERFVQPVYQQAAEGNYELIRELQEFMTQPYAEQSKEVEDKYYGLRPAELRNLGGVSHYSCSS